MRTIPRLLGALAIALVATGCNRYGYSAHIDSVEPSGYYLQASGWVQDPVATRRGGNCVLRWQVDGKATFNSGCDDSNSRPDVDAARGPRGTGFDRVLVGEGLARGAHHICVDVVPRDATTARFQPLHCRDYVLPWDLFDRSSLDVATADGSTIVAAGWYSDYTSVSWSSFRAFSVDGVTNPTGATIAFVDRPDVSAAMGPGARGLSMSLPSTPGVHTVCIGKAVQNTGTPQWGALGGATTCRTVTVT